MKESHGNQTIFTPEEVGKFMMVSRLESNYIEIECGCTLRRFGDSYGNLKVYVDGRILIDCRCTSDCRKENLTPVQFTSHLRKSTNVDTWKQHIWVMDKDGTKIKLTETCLLRYHIQTFQRSLRHRVHRDEFIRCSKCNKERRFRLHSQEQYRLYHRASLNRDWQCSDTPEIGKTCDDVEQRQSRRSSRGCPKTPKCSGCLRCVCTGCRMCRFEDCECRICSDYVQNVWQGGSD